MKTKLMTRFSETYKFSWFHFGKYNVSIHVGFALDEMTMV
jgi:hypothetical protein